MSNSKIEFKKGDLVKVIQSGPKDFRGKKFIVESVEMGYNICWFNDGDDDFCIDGDYLDLVEKQVKTEIGNDKPEFKKGDYVKVLATAAKEADFAKRKTYKVETAEENGCWLENPEPGRDSFYIYNRNLILFEDAINETKTNIFDVGDDVMVLDSGPTHRHGEIYTVKEIEGVNCWMSEQGSTTKDFFIPKKNLQLIVRKSDKGIMGVTIPAEPETKGPLNIEQPENALDVQVGGNHYKNLPIQPIVFTQKNKLGSCESAVVKYICRHGQKGGRKGGLKDLNKIKHYVDLLIELEYEGVKL